MMMAKALTWKLKAKTLAMDLPTCKRALNQLAVMWMYRPFQEKERPFWHGFRAINQTRSANQKILNFESQNPVSRSPPIKNISSHVSLRANFRICRCLLRNAIQPHMWGAKTETGLLLPETSVLQKTQGMTEHLTI